MNQIVTVITYFIQGSSLSKNIPGADALSGSIPRLSRSVPEPAV